MDVMVYKLNETGQQVWSYPARVLARDGACVRLEAFFNRDDMDLGYVTFQRGDRFIETFYADRWYNVFAVYDRDAGDLKGWYCNVCRPAVLSPTAVTCEDLALDVWVDPAGAATVLDADEFAALDIPERDRRHGREALQTLLALAAAGVLPR